MTDSLVVVSGVVQPDGTLEVGDKVRLPPGRVRVTVETIPVPPLPRSQVLALLEEIGRNRHDLPPGTPDSTDLLREDRAR